MAWTIILEDENKEQLDAVLEELDSAILKDGKKNQLFKLLKYLDPYEDTTFNTTQIDDLLIDLEVLKKYDVNKDLIHQIIALAIKCKNESHTYLTFYGD
ncbi:hypothetical protein [Sediminibacterium goheungense]|uniref:Uncharacterized protein n=1 Tax=Sediminibacterium goheungense TaxID=1086393 RepID=A0A4R6J342_9BACT|nr:hypothetical protein [Sediminibacterium goheungense]TDO28696.1 hypothetical protein BC659_0776 [Sediminibacterium goheungense]